MPEELHSGGEKHGGEGGCFRAKSKRVALVGPFCSACEFGTNYLVGGAVWVSCRKNIPPKSVE